MQWMERIYGKWAMHRMVEMRCKGNREDAGEAGSSWDP